MVPERDCAVRDDRLLLYVRAGWWDQQSWPHIGLLGYGYCGVRHDCGGGVLEDRVDQ